MVGIEMQEIKEFPELMLQQKEISQALRENQNSLEPIFLSPPAFSEIQVIIARLLEILRDVQNPKSSSKDLLLVFLQHLMARRFFSSAPIFEKLSLVQEFEKIREHLIREQGFIDHFAQIPENLILEKNTSPQAESRALPFLIEALNFFEQKFLGKGMKEQALFLAGSAPSLIKNLFTDREKDFRQVYINCRDLDGYYFHQLRDRFGDTGPDRPSIVWSDHLRHLSFLGIQTSLFRVSQSNTKALKAQQQLDFQLIGANLCDPSFQKTSKSPELDKRIRERHLGKAISSKVKINPLQRHLYWMLDRLAPEGLLLLQLPNEILESKSYFYLRKHFSTAFSTIYLIDLEAYSLAFMVRAKSSKSPGVFYNNLSPLNGFSQKLDNLQNARWDELEFRKMDQQEGSWRESQHPEFDGFIPLYPSSEESEEACIFHQYLVKDKAMGKKSPPAPATQKKSTSQNTKDHPILYFLPPTKTRPGEAHLLDSFAYIPIKKALRIPWSSQNISEEAWQAFQDHYESQWQEILQSQQYYLNRLLDFSEFENCQVSPELAQEMRPLTLLDGQSKSLQRIYKTLAQPDEQTEQALKSFLKTFHQVKKVFDRIGKKTCRGQESYDILHNYFQEGQEAQEALLTYLEDARIRSQASLKQSIHKTDIIHYVYAQLLNPHYWHHYQDRLLQEVPRIPFYANFWQWVEWGKKLGKLHQNPQDLEGWKLKTAHYALLKPKKNLEFKYQPEDKTLIIKKGNDEIQLSPLAPEAFHFTIAGKPVLEWYLMFLKKQDADSWRDDKETYLNKLSRLVRLCIESRHILEEMELWTTQKP